MTITWKRTETGLISSDDRFVITRKEFSNRWGEGLKTEYTCLDTAGDRAATIHNLQKEAKEKAKAILQYEAEKATWVRPEDLKVVLSERRSYRSDADPDELLPDVIAEFTTKGDVILRQWNDFGPNRGNWERVYMYGPAARALRDLLNTEPLGD